MSLTGLVPVSEFTRAECLTWCSSAVEASLEAVVAYVTPDSKETELFIRINTESKICLNDESLPGKED